MARDVYKKMRDKKESTEAEAPEEFKKNVSKLEPYVPAPEVPLTGFDVKAKLPDESPADTVFWILLTGPTRIIDDGSATMELRDGADSIYFEYGAGDYTASLILVSRFDGSTIKLLNTVKFTYDGNGRQTFTV